jgi:RsiW-degrading membrane proteinase PrsW (M82 family)
MLGDVWRRMVAQPRLVNGLLAVALLWSALYAAHMLVDIARPHVFLGGNGPTGDPIVGLLAAKWPIILKVTFWGMVVSWAGTVLMWCTAAGYRRLTGNHPPAGVASLRLLTALLLLLPFTFFPASIVFGHPLAVLACLPTTAYALWLVSRLQRYRRVPGGLLLGVFGWGALLATGIGGASNLWVEDYSTSYLLAVHNGEALNGEDLFRMAQAAHTALFASAGLFEELGKGTAVLLVYLLLRRHIDDVVAGIVLGAAAGLGFNLVESVEFITAAGHSAGFEYWIRQSVGLMAAHTAFSALIGAGFGLARQLSSPQARVTAIAAGYIAAAGGHFANDVMLAWWGGIEPRIFGAVSAALDTLLIQPLVLVLLQGPFVVGYLLLRKRGVDEEVEGLTRVLEAEAANGSGAVRPPEIEPLLDVARRRRLRITTLRRYGMPVYRRLLTLQRAQYALAFRLWHQARDDEEFGESDGVLRERVIEARRELIDLFPAPTGQIAQVPA